MDDAIPSGTADLSYITELDPHRNAFTEAMSDDFNTPQAIAALFDFNKEVNTLLDSNQPLGRGTLAAIDGLYRDLGGKVLGIIPDSLTQDIGGDLVEGLMDIILDIRQRYREAKEWTQADALRRRLTELGVAIDDGSDGSTWRVEPKG
jgi:cysteinyl-tRNA synthetase